MMITKENEGNITNIVQFYPLSFSFQGTKYLSVYRKGKWVEYGTEGKRKKGEEREKGRGLGDRGAANDVVAFINEIRGDGSSLLRVH